MACHSPRAGGPPAGRNSEVERTGSAGEGSVCARVRQPVARTGYGCLACRPKACGGGQSGKALLLASLQRNRDCCTIAIVAQCRGVCPTPTNPLSPPPGHNCPQAVTLSRRARAERRVRRLPGGCQANGASAPASPRWRVPRPPLFLMKRPSWWHVAAAQATPGRSLRPAGVLQWDAPEPLVGHLRHQQLVAALRVWPVEVHGDELYQVDVIVRSQRR